MTGSEKHASKNTVKDFILAAKCIAGVNLTPREERMLEVVLVSEKITDGGIEVTFTERKITVASRDVRATYHRR